MLYPFYTPYSTLSEKEKKGKKPGSKKFFRYVIKCSYIFDKILRKFSGSSLFFYCVNEKQEHQNTEEKQCSYSWSQRQETTDG